MRGLRPASFGARPEGERLRRVLASPHFDAASGVFRNPAGPAEPPHPAPPAGGRAEMLRALLRRDGRRPVSPVPVHTPDLSAAPDSGLRLTWCGHSTVLAEIDGHRVLFDPVWGERCSPFGFAGPRRFHRPPLALSDVGPLDVVVVSHDHYDHLDMPSILALARTGVRFAVPLGVGAHLEHWGVRTELIAELDWHESTTIGALTLTATPARHFCGRGLRNKQQTLWASWSVAGPRHRVFHSGDTGYFPGFADIGRVHGPFDVSMIQIGAYSPHWPDIHMTPEEGLLAHRDLDGGVLLPIHWGTFNLAPHPWDEPAERSLTGAAAAGVRIAVPPPGLPFEAADSTLPTDRWWQRDAPSDAASPGTAGARRR